MLTHLDPFDLVEIAIGAARRSAVKEALHTRSNKFTSDRSEFELHYIGFIGEFVVAKALGVSTDRSVKIGSDNGVDLMFRDASIQVKAFTYTAGDPDLLFNSLTEFKADLAVGVQILSPVRTKIMGWMSREDFVTKHRVSNYGYGDRVVVGQKQLSPISALIDL
tara:strand:- start:311 stop:802 length:492 start_codon:yes stop_codon:yes gene_type:complete